MEIIQLTDEMAEEWDDVVIHSDDTWLFHMFHWLKLTEEVWGFRRYSIFLKHEKQIIGVLPLQAYRDRNILKSSIMGLGGAALIRDLPDKLRKKALKVMYEYVESFARDNDFPRVEVYLPSLCETKARNKFQVNPLIDHYYEDTSTQTWVVDLKLSEEEIFKNFADDARRTIKKALELGCTIKKVTSIEGIDRYYEVHCETYKRTGVEPHPKEYFVGLYEMICKKKHATIWEAVNKDGISVAFEIIGLFNNNALYWSGCSRTDYLNSGINYLLQYHSMMWARKQGARWYETGEAFPNARDGKLKGLNTFKKKFGGQMHRLFRGRLMLNVEEDRTMLQDWFRATANLIEPVIGHEFIQYIVNKSNKNTKNSSEL